MPLDPLDRIPLPPPGGRPLSTVPAHAPSPAVVLTNSPADADTLAAVVAGATATAVAATRRKRNTALTPLPTPDQPVRVGATERAALAVVEAELGGRQKMVSALSQAHLDKDAGRVFRMLADPGNDARSFAEVCQRANISPRKVLDAIEGSLTARAQLLSKMHIAHKLPDVARAVMDDAIPGLRPCETCNGLGQITLPPSAEDKNPSPVGCVTCLGKGEVPYYPELAIRKVALGLGGLTEKAAAGTKVNIVNNNKVGAFAGGATAETYEKLTNLTDRLMYGEGRQRLVTVEDEIVEGEVAE